MNIDIDIDLAYWEMDPSEKETMAKKLIADGYIVPEVVLEDKVAQTHTERELQSLLVDMWDNKVHFDLATIEGLKAQLNNIL